jgi:hypothetical protein
MDVEWVRELDLYDPSEAAAFEEVAEAIGYREVTEEPLAVLSRFDADEVGLGLLARAQVLAADDERYDEEPLVNLMDGSIHPETLRRIEETSEHDGYAIRHVPGSNVNSLAKDYLHESDFFRVVNPVRAEYTFRDKEFFFDSVYRSGLPVLPSADIAGVIAYEGKYLDEGPIAADRHVIKPGDRAGGTGVEAVEGLEDVREYVERWFRHGDELLEEWDEWEQEYFRPVGYRVEPFVEHASDVRVFVGDEPFSAEERYGDPDDFRCNLSQVEGEGWQKMVDVFEDDLADVRTVGTDVEGLEDLAPGVRAVVEDLRDWYVDYYGLDDCEELPLMVAADVMVTDREAVEHVDAAYREDILSYADGDEVYVLNEVNGFGGDLIGHLQFWEGNYEEMPVVHEYLKLRRTAGLDAPEPSDVVENGASRLWRRIEDHYPSLESARERAADQ